MQEKEIIQAIQHKLREIEEKEHVNILYAVESGSRSWGFASPDSDYDVRFIYVRTREDYLRLDQKRDVIEWQLDEVFDINGWDIRKVLAQFHKSNTTVFEWSNSPIVYHKRKEWENVYQAAQEYFSVKAALYHYYGVAKSTYCQFLSGKEIRYTAPGTRELMSFQDGSGLRPVRYTAPGTRELMSFQDGGGLRPVRYKKYFYALRPLLSCHYIWEHRCPPPIVFDELMKTELPADLRKEIEELVEKKKQTLEGDEHLPIPRIQDFIVHELELWKQRAAEIKDDQKKDWEALNKVFFSLTEWEKSVPE